MAYGKLTFQKFITREDMRANPNTLYVFGDNMRRVGMGGQAKEMRGEPNAVGIPTKHAPGMNETDFFSDEDISNPIVRNAIMSGFHALLHHIEDGGNVIYPEDGIGSGLSQLPTRAPKIDRSIKEVIAFLSTLSESDD
jgi:hypothetical protein